MDKRARVSLLSALLMTLASAPAMAESPSQGAREATKSAKTTPAPLPLPNTANTLRLQKIESENAKLRREVVDLKVEMVDLREHSFDSTKTTVTFLLSWAAISASYAGAGANFGGDDWVVPSLIAGAAIGFGPAAITGLGAGLDSTPVVVGGVAFDLVIAALPWLIGAGVTSFMSENNISMGPQQAPAILGRPIRF